MTHKFNLLRRAIMPAAMLLAVGCSGTDLALSPVDKVPSTEAIVDAPTAHAALTGSYAALQSLSYYGRMIEVLGDLPSDNAEWSGTYQYLGDVDRNAISADNSAVTGLWDAIYDGINRDNMIISKVPTLTNIASSDANDILGQAYFLRALHYHNLVKLWGGVPLILAPLANANDASSIPRANVATVYTQILSDLDKADQLITNTDNTRQATPGASMALRARVLLYKGDYQGALDAANAVIAMGYSLAPDYADLFTATGSDTPEDIFRVIFTAQQYNEMGYYYLGSGRREVRPTRDLNNTYEAGDLRHPLTVIPRRSAFQGVKFPTTQGTEHLHVIRFAEVILIQAEALARLGQLSAAVDAYNMIRVRAGLAPHVLGVDVTTQADVLAAIDHERRVELALEGDRWPDLVRTGQAVSVLGLSSINQTLFPIPASEISTDPALTQNPGY